MAIISCQRYFCIIAKRSCICKRYFDDMVSVIRKWDIIYKWHVLVFAVIFWNSTNAVKGLHYKNGAKKVSNYDKRFNTIHCIIFCLFHAPFLFAYMFIVVHHLWFRALWLSHFFLSGVVSLSLLCSLFKFCPVGVI